MSMVGFPLLLIPLAVYNIIVFLMPGVSLAAPLFSLPLISGAAWPVTLGDLLLTLGTVLLLLEVIKGARPGAKYLTDHLLSFVICAGAIAEFLLWPRFATSTFFLLTLLALVDFLSGVALRAHRRVPAAGGPHRAPAGAQVRDEGEVHPPRQAPAATNAEPAGPAQPAARSTSETTPASPEVASPELQPGDGSQRPPPTPH